MIKKIILILNELEKLSDKDQKIFSSLSNYQLKVLNYLKKKKIEKVSTLISLKDESSRAQKYRFINQLINKKICKQVDGKIRIV
jgi:hypothetical protein